MAANFKFLRFVSYKSQKPITKAKAAVKYITAPREYHRNTPELFNEGQNHVKRKDFYKEIEAQPKYGVCIHKWKISLSEQERDELKIDMREWTRDFMARVEKEYGKRLSWCAAVHDDKGHPHVHIIIRGYTKDGKIVGFYKRDRDKLEKIADEEKRLQAVRNLGPEEAEKRMERLNKIAEEVQKEKERLGIPRNESLARYRSIGGDIVRGLTDAFAQMLWDAEREREQARRRAIREARKKQKQRGKGR